MSLGLFSTHVVGPSRAPFLLERFSLVLFPRPIITTLEPVDVFSGSSLTL